MGPWLQSQLWLTSSIFQLCRCQTPGRTQSEQVRAVLGLEARRSLMDTHERAGLLLQSEAQHCDLPQLRHRHCLLCLEKQGPLHEV
jgi:hypothetical protein